jgi:hypothetical protein
MYFKKLVRDGSGIQEDGEITPSSDSITVLVSQLVQSSNPASRKVDCLVSVSSADLEVGVLDVDSSKTLCRPSSSKLSTLVPCKDQESRVDADRKVLGTHSRYSELCSTGSISPRHTPSLFTVEWSGRRSLGDCSDRLWV